MQGFTYAQLMAALQTWPEDDASEYVADLPRIIALGELRLVRDLNLELFDQEVTSIIVTGNNRAVPKPTDPVVVTTRALYFVNPQGVSTPLYLRSREFCEQYAPDVTQLGQPKYYYEYSETAWRIVPTPNQSGTAKAHVVARPLGLSASTTTTWLSRNVGDLLFDCCLMEAEHWIKADDRYGDIKTKYYEEKLPAARLELRNLLRNGEAYSPYKPAATKAG